MNLIRNQKNKKIAVLIPCYNEAKTIEKVVNDYKKALPDADIYVYAHATAPFVTIQTMKKCIEAVAHGDYDSAFCAVKMQDYLWQDGMPLNFDATNIPRTQDLKPIYQETSGVYVFTKNVFLKYRRRVGINPYIAELNFKEAIDIDTPEDFELAEAMVNI